MNLTLKKTLIVALCLGAVVAANLSVSLFGPSASIVNAFLLIGLALSTRDALSELWGRHLIRNMALLIASGSALSYLTALALADPALPPDVVSRIALASFTAFASAETSDAVVYHALRRRGWRWSERANASNLAGAMFDSVVFVAIAFPGFDWQVAVAQFSAKVAGAMVWTWVLTRTLKRDVEPATP